MSQGFEAPFGMGEELAEAKEAEAQTEETPKPKRRGRKTANKPMPEGEPGLYAIQLRHAPFLTALKSAKIKADSPADAWEKFLVQKAKHQDKKQVALFRHWCEERDPADDQNISIKLYDPAQDKRLQQKLARAAA